MHPFWLIPALALLSAVAPGEEKQTGQSPGPFQWQARANSISVQPALDVPGEGAASAAVRIHGRIEEGWNYAATGRVPIEPGRLYRVSVRLRVDRLGGNAPPPYLKCEFVPAAANKSLGQSHTNSYEPPLGRWQTLVGEFQAPQGATGCWLALEKGTEAPAEIDALLGDVRLIAISRLTVLDRYRLKPIPAPLEKLRGVHPRIYLTEHKVAELRQAIRGSHAGLWRQVRDEADRAVKRGPPTYREQDGRSGDEQLWQREVGNTLPVLAMAYALSGERKYLAAAQQWALASCGYKTWGLGRIDGMDLAAGHQLLGLALVYDWCYRDLDAAARDEIRRTLVRRTSAMHDAAATEKIWWHRSYMQNHLWVNIAGMAISGLALFDEVDDAACWIGLPLDKFRRTMAVLGPDGASHEGVGYWEYGVEYMLKFMDPAQTLLGVDLYESSPWWRNTSAYGLYLSLPRRAWRRSNCIVDIADCPRGHWYGPEYLMRALARRFRDGHAQWLAVEIDAAEVSSAGASWLNLVWHDPTVEAKSPSGLPTLRHFEDMGIVAARSDWSGDESLAVLKCGPCLGHQGVDEFTYDPGSGHVHPDANHFVLFGNGQWLIRDDGYQDKWTGQHNTLLVDGRGQLGEGSQWFRGSEPLARKSKPKILRAISTAEFDHLIGDATEAYAPELGLKRFVRHMVFVKPNLLVVADDIERDKPGELELRFHPEQEAVPEGDAFVARGKRAVLRIAPLPVDGVRASAERIALAGRHGGNAVGIPTVRLVTKANRWRNAVVLTWSQAAAAPRAVSVSRDKDLWTFRSDAATLTLDWSKNRVEMGK